jgi:hypothetical protein
VRVCVCVWAVEDPSPEHSYGYLKLVGVTADNQLVDVIDWSIGTKLYRERAKLPPPPKEQANKVQQLVDRPKGNRQLKTAWEKYGDRWAPGFEPLKTKPAV